DVGAERGVGERHRHLDRRVVAAAAEQLVGPPPHGDEEIARRPTVAAGLASTLQPDALPVVDRCRHADLDLACSASGAGATAVAARIGDDAPPPTART